VAPDDPPGSATVTASFAGDDNYGPSSAVTTFTITKEETVLNYTGDTKVVIKGTAHVSALLAIDDGGPVAGRSVTFTLGTGKKAQTCTATTDANGSASCTIAAVNPPTGSRALSVSFAGDDFYQSGSASAPVQVTK
jgi:hypothetical protein